MNPQFTPGSSITRLSRVSDSTSKTPIGVTSSRGVLLSVPGVFRFAENATKPEKAVPADVAKLLSGGLTRAQYKTFIELLYVFDEACKAHGITYFLFSGSLLGSWRCHCLLQWDDDMDLMVNTKDRPKLLTILRQLAPKYTAVDHKDSLIKFYKTADSKTIPMATWRWPFIDVTFYREDGPYIRDTNPWWKHQAHKRSDIFPLYYRPFEGLDVLAPHNPSTTLRKLYGNIENCATQEYSHRKERMDKDLTRVTCDELKTYHPFVKRTILENGMQEVLMFGDRKLHEKFLNTSSM